MSTWKTKTKTYGEEREIDFGRLVGVVTERDKTITQYTAGPILSFIAFVHPVHFLYISYTFPCMHFVLFFLVAEPNFLIVHQNKRKKYSDSTNRCQNIQRGTKPGANLDHMVARSNLNWDAQCVHGWWITFYPEIYERSVFPFTTLLCVSILAAT